MTFSQSLHFSEFQFLYLTKAWVVLNGFYSPVWLQNSFPGHSPFSRIALDSYLVLMLVASVFVSSTSDKVTWFHPIYLCFSPWEPLLRPQTYQEWNFSNCPTSPPPRPPQNIHFSISGSLWLDFYTWLSFIAILFIPCCIAKPPSNLPIWNNNHFLRLTILWVRNQGRHSGASLSPEVTGASAGVGL